jgi:hypothetical protein
MTAKEQELHRKDVADLHLAVARRFEHAGILFHAPSGWCQEDLRLFLLHLRELSNLDYWAFWRLALCYIIYLTPH